jgi:hypothetical protein
MSWGLLKGLQMEVGQLLGIKTNRRCFKYYRVAENLLSLGAYLHNWVNWLERESDHKPL